MPMSFDLAARIFPARAGLLALALTASAIAPVLAQSSGSVQRPVETHSVQIADLAFAPYAGTSVPLTATVITNGVATPGASVTWESSNYAVAWVAPSGDVIFLRPGHVTLTARYATSQATRSFEVRDNPVERLALPVPARTPMVGDTVRFTARATSGHDGLITDAHVMYALTARGAERTAASIGEDGAFVARAPGLYTIVATVGGVAATQSFEVRAGQSDHTAAYSTGGNGTRISLYKPDYGAYAGTMLPISARVSSRSGGDASAPLRWTSSDTTVAIVDAEGLVAFRKPGRVRITTEAGDASESESFNVIPNPVARLAMNVKQRDLRVGDRVALGLFLWARGGYLIKNLRVNLAVASHGGSGSFTEDGEFVAAAPGVYDIVAESGGLAEHMTVLVNGAADPR
jgi:hypothetical protein